MNTTCIHSSDAKVENSTNQDWVLLCLSCWYFDDTDTRFNGVYWHVVFIVYSGYPMWSTYWRLLPCILGNEIITDLYEDRYGSCWMFVDMIIHSLNHHIMMVVYSPPFKGYQWVTQGNTLSPNIFNMVVNSVISNWVMMVVWGEGGP